MQYRRMFLGFGMALVVALLSATLVAGPAKERSAEAAFPGAENLTVQNQECLPTGRVSVSFSWNSFGNGPIWADLSLFNNGFAPDTFVNLGPMASGTGQLVWDGLLPGRTHYARVNTLTAQGWFPSNTVAFMTPPCNTDPTTNFPGADNLRLSSQRCLPGGNVGITLDWVSYDRGVQWVDLSRINDTFGPGSYVNQGPVASGDSALIWDGLEPRTRYFARVTTLTDRGWIESEHISFTTTRCDSNYSTDPQSIDGNAQPQDPAVLVEVTTGQHADDGYDRIVFEFANALPDATVEYTSSPAACGSGMPVDVEGPASLAVSMTVATAHANGETTVNAQRVDGPGGSILEAVQSCDFENHVTWIVGTPDQRPFHVFTLMGPPRLVVDVRR